MRVVLPERDPDEYANRDRFARVPRYWSISWWRIDS